MKLRPYQERMRELAVERNTLIAAPPGLGKTAAMLYAIHDQVFDRVAVRRVLWCGPKIVVSDTIPNEIDKWGLNISYTVWTAEKMGLYVREDGKLRVRDPEGLKARVLADPAILHLISHDHYYRFVLTLGSDWPFELQILDESWAFSDMDSGRFKACQAVQAHTNVRTVMLNGTPIGNGLPKLWAQMLLIDGGAALGKTLTQFQMRYMEPDKINPREGRVYSWKPKDGSVDAIVEACRGRLLTLRETDWLTLPAFVPVTYYVDIPRAEYNEMERECLLELDGDREALAQNAGILYNKLAQLANGICYDTETDWHEIHRVKIDKLLELREAHPGPLLIWTSFQPDIERICAAIPGARAAVKVKNLERDWNAGKIRTLVAHPLTLAAGANLQDAPGSAMCWFGITSNALHWNQGVKRLHRSGRREPVVCYSIVARGTVEEGMIARRLERGAVEEEIMSRLAWSS